MRKKKKIPTYIDENGKEHIVVKLDKVPNKMHFEHQLKTRVQIVESKKHKKPKYKKDLRDYQD